MLKKRVAEVQITYFLNKLREIKAIKLKYFQKMPD